MKFYLLVLAIALSACSSVSARKGDWEFTRSSFGTLVGVGKLVITEDGPGKMSVEIEGVKSDQVEGLKAVAEGVAQGLAKAAAP